MKFDNNFVPVPAGRSNIIDADLQIRMATGRWNPESSAKGGSVDIVLFHDPEILPDRLTMSPPEKVVRNRELLGAPPISQVVFQSDHCSEIAKLTIDIDRQDGEVALIHRGGRDPSFKYIARLIELAQKGRVSEHPWKTIRYILEALPLMPLWEDEYAKQWGAKRIGVYISRPLAEELSKLAGVPAPIGESDLVQIASREIAA
ncbi:MAG: hypothetical protein ACK5JT_00755 [Hyphomicrobiaceae bacterium]